MTSALRVLRIVVLILVPQVLQAQPAPRNEVTWWPRLVDGFESSSPGFTLLGSHRDIEVSLLMSNDTTSPGWLVLDAGFFRQVAMTLREEATGRLVAAVSEWRDTGFCGGHPDCHIDSDVFLAPGLGAAFVAILSTVDGQPLAEGQYVLRAALETARQRIREPNGSLWSGKIADGSTTPVTVRPVRDAADLRRFDSIRAQAAARRSDHAEALAIYQGMIDRDPMDAGAHGFVARTLVQLRRLPEAAEAYERMLAIQPSAVARGGAEVIGAEVIAAVYFALREDAKALAILQRYVPADRRQAAERESRQGGARLRNLP